MWHQSWACLSLRRAPARHRRTQSYSNTSQGQQTCLGHASSSLGDLILCQRCLPGMWLTPAMLLPFCFLSKNFAPQFRCRARGWDSWGQRKPLCTPAGRQQPAWPSLSRPATHYHSIHFQPLEFVPCRHLCWRQQSVGENLLLCTRNAFQVVFSSLFWMRRAKMCYTSLTPPPNHFLVRDGSALENPNQFPNCSRLRHTGSKKTATEENPRTRRMQSSVLYSVCWIHFPITSPNFH
jgi:hypothetical protein